MNATRKMLDEYPSVTLRPARADDLPAIVELLDGQGLATDGVGKRLRRFWVAEDRDGPARRPRPLAGVAGLEVYGDTALLRSVAVAPAWRRSGLGRLLTERALEDAENAGARDIVLLTTTAEYFKPSVEFLYPAPDATSILAASSGSPRGCCGSAASSCC